MALASPNQPLVLADGTKIDPTTGAVIRDMPEMVEVPSNVETQRELAYVRRTIRDLPELPEKMNVISVVLSYELFGLAPRDISIAIKLSIAQIQAIQASDVYKSYKEDIIRRFEETEAETVRGLLAKHATNAAKKVIRIASSNNDGLALKASESILDRSGHRPVDVVEHRHKVDGDLRITYISANDSNTIPKVNIIDGEFDRDN